MKRSSDFHRFITILQIKLVCNLILIDVYTRGKVSTEFQQFISPEPRLSYLMEKWMDYRIDTLSWRERVLKQENPHLFRSFCCKDMAISCWKTFGV